MTPLPLAIFGSINPIELLVVVAAALMIFGSRLPEVALRAVAHVMRARRAVSKMWRETGLEDELRRVRRDIELNIPREADFDVKAPAPRPLPAAGVSEEFEEDGPDDDGSADPDADRVAEPFDSSVTIEPAEGVVAAGDWTRPEEDPDAERREPDGEYEEAVTTEEPPAEAPSAADSAPDVAPGGDDDPSKQAG